MHSKTLVSTIAITALLAAASSPVRAAAVRTIPGITANTLNANDDGSTAAVAIGFTVNFFGVTKDKLFVNNNGNVTFNSALGSYTPTGISSSVNQPMIAPFFADVDTRGSGSGLVQYGNGTLCGRTVFGVNWVNVGYYGQHTDKLNSFQLIMIERFDTGPGNFDIEINYDTIKWETGDASGGSGGLGGKSVEAGYTNGLGGAARVSFELPGSRINGAMLDGGPNALILGKIASKTPGRYHFFVRNGNIGNDPPAKDLDITATTKVFLPLRFVYNNNANTFFGHLTLKRTKNNTGPVSGTEKCLDEIVTVQQAATPAPITIVVRKLPPGVTCAYPKVLLTKAGFPYFTVPSSTLEPGESILFGLSLRNPRWVVLENYLIGSGYIFQIVAGKFDPSKY